MTIFFYFWQNLDIYEQKSHDTIVILEIKKKISVSILPYSHCLFSRKNKKKQQAYYGAQMGFSTHVLIFLLKITMTMP